jgi:hypothetical protein
MKRRDWTFLDAISDRLRHSRNPAERRSIYKGQSYHYGYPVLLDTDLLSEHMQVLGPPGAGKTSLGLQTDVIQLIYQGNGPVVIFDAKGDPAFFHSVRQAAKRAGRTFKWFTNKPYRSTYIFNPWDQKLLSRLTLPDILGLITNSLNLHHGEDYGRAWFGMNARILLRRAILETVPHADKRNLVTPHEQSRLFPKYGPIQSFCGLYPILRDLAHDSDEFRAAQHLTFIIESLTDFQQINLAPDQHPNHPALDHAIHMPEVIREKQVVYFYLVGAVDLAAVAELAKLALYSLLMAAIEYHDEYGVPARIYSVWDEAQVMIAKNIEMVLAQARSNGLGCILSHQSMSQLNPPGGIDLRELVMTCTVAKHVFGVRDPWLLQYISNTSGTTKYFRKSYDVAAQDVLNGTVGPQFTCQGGDGKFRINVHEYTGPRLTYQDILNFSRQPNVGLLWIDRVSGLSQFRGWFPIHTNWPVSQAAHRRYRAQPWPGLGPETIDTRSIWPTENEHTITPTTHPSVAPTEHEVDASAKLRAIRRQLEEK